MDKPKPNTGEQGSEGESVNLLDLLSQLSRARYPYGEADRANARKILKFTSNGAPNEVLPLDFSASFSRLCEAARRAAQRILNSEKAPN